MKGIFRVRRPTMSKQVLVGYSGWNYGETPNKGGWTGVFYLLDQLL